MSFNLELEMDELILKAVPLLDMDHIQESYGEIVPDTFVVNVVIIFVKHLRQITKEDIEQNNPTIRICFKCIEENERTIFEFGR